MVRQSARDFACDLTRTLVCDLKSMIPVEYITCYVIYRPNSPESGKTKHADVH